MNLAVTDQVEATFSLGLEKDYDKKYSENLVCGWGIAKIHPYNVDDLFLLWDEINEYPADKYSYKTDENNKEIFNFTEKYNIPTSFFNSSEGWFCVCIYKRDFYDKTFLGTFRATYKYTVSESILRIERETDVSKMIWQNNQKKEVWVISDFLFICGCREKFSAIFCKIFVKYPDKRLVTFQL